MRCGICSKERNLFLCSSRNKQPFEQSAGTHFLQGGHWHWSEKARSHDIVCWSYLSWGDEWTPEYRLLEIAILIATGHMTEIIPSYLNNFQSLHWEKLGRLLQTPRFDTISPVRSRIRIMPQNSTSCYVLLCISEETPVICVFNLSESSQNICIDLSEEIHTLNYLWSDTISGRNVTPKDNCLRLTISAFDFAFLSSLK